MTSLKQLRFVKGSKVIKGVNPSPIPGYFVVMKKSGEQLGFVFNWNPFPRSYWWYQRSGSNEVESGGKTRINAVSLLVHKSRQRR